jgi:serine/threonine protein kinase
MLELCAEMGIPLESIPLESGTGGGGGGGGLKGGGGGGEGEGPPPPLEDIEDMRKCVVKDDRGMAEVSMQDLDVDHNPIGAGSFKVVFRARLRRDIAGVGDQGCKVAVMQIRQGISTLAAELNVFIILGKHPNLTRLVAVVRSDTGDVVSLVTEFAEMGSFENVLTDVTDRGQKATADVLLTAAMQVLDAMLQLQEHKMLHRDVALRNLLVFHFDPSDCDQVHVKLTDYGLAVTGSYIRMSTSNVGNGLPIRWMSPEAITHRRWSEKSDLWAFAVTLWEMFTHGGVPYMFIPSDEDVGQRVVQGHRLERPLSPAECPEGIFAVMLKCWQEKPEARPTFVEVKRMIQAEFRKGA